MLGMLVGHARDVENDAGDVDGLVCNSSISRENAAKYNILLKREKQTKQIRKTSQNKSQFEKCRCPFMVAWIDGLAVNPPG